MLPNSALPFIYDQLSPVTSLENFWNLLDITLRTPYSDQTVAKLGDQWQLNNVGLSSPGESVSDPVLGTAIAVQVINPNTSYLAMNFAGGGRSESLRAAWWEKYNYLSDAPVNSLADTGNEGVIFTPPISSVRLGSGIPSIIKAENSNTRVANGPSLRVLQSEPTKFWTKLLGSSFYDYATALTTGNDGAIYMSGTTGGNLDGQTNNGLSDVFITKYNTDGSKVWTKLLGTTGEEEANALTTGKDGAIYVSGYTEGTLDGQVNRGLGDVFITKYNTDGTKVWTRLWGSVSYDQASALTTGNDGLIYASGYTLGSVDGQINNGGYDTFISKYNLSGTRIWTRMLGSSSDDYSSALTTGSDGSIYLGGYTFGDLDGQINNGSGDAFITKYSIDGTKVWTKLLGSSSYDKAYALTTGNDGAIYISGYTEGSLDSQLYNGNGDAFISKYNADGTKAWTKLLGSTGYDYATALTTGNDGAIYVSGYTQGSFDGQTNSGGVDNFIAKYNPDGTKIWTKLFGSSSHDYDYALTTGIDGSIYTSGYTFGNLDNQVNNGSSDAFLVKYQGNTDATKSQTNLLGTTGNDLITALAIAGDGSFYGSGFTEGSLDGQINNGLQDAFVIKYNADGTKAWTQLLGSTGNDVAQSLTTGTDGAIYVGGYTNGNLDTQINSGLQDAFLTKYNTDGTKAWTQLLGTTGNDGANALRTGNDGAIYVSGYTAGNLEGKTNSGLQDTFLTKYNTDGTKAWTQLLGSTNDDVANALTIGNDGTIYVGGYTLGNLDGQSNGGLQDGFVTKYNTDGTKLWTKLLGATGIDVISALTTGNDGSIYATGATKSNLDGQINSGGYDVFLTKYTVDGTKVWTKLLGTASDDYAYALRTANDGTLYLSGYSGGNLGGQINSGSNDAFIAKYNTDGTMIWTKLLGSTGTDVASALVADNVGTFYVGGYSSGNLDGQINSGNNDAFITKYQEDLPTLSINDVTVLEGVDTSAVLTINLSKVSSQAISFSYTISSLTATANADYTSQTGTLTIAPNSTSTTLSIPILDDNINESDETFMVTLSNPINATLNDNQGIVTITDMVYSSVTYTLPSTVENLTLTGTGNINGTGNDNNNIIIGNIGNNTLTGAAGIDTLIGGLGNDSYTVDSTMDVINENAGEGSDTVRSSVTFSLATLPNLENLTLTGTGAINATGNNGNNILTGNNGNNLLEGGAGNDSLVGGSGTDTAYYLNAPASVTVNLTTGIANDGQGGTDTLSQMENIQGSSTGGDSLTGNSGVNIIYGDGGADILTGAGGNDSLYLGSDLVSDTVNYANGDGSDNVFNFVRGLGGDVLNFTGITAIDVRVSGSNTLLRVGDGISGNTGFATGALLLTINGTTGFSATDVGVNLLGATFAFS
ncbi:MAG: Calx-beta domain-containing protein [Snowella sp.]|nr:Calx-beta domain-containing protein [Snowella sp.]